MVFTCFHCSLVDSYSNPFELYFECHVVLPWGWEEAMSYRRAPSTMPKHVDIATGHALVHHSSDEHWLQGECDVRWCGSIPITFLMPSCHLGDQMFATFCDMFKRLYKHLVHSFARFLLISQAVARYYEYINDITQSVIHLQMQAFWILFHSFPAFFSEEIFCIRDCTKHRWDRRCPHRDGTKDQAPTDSFATRHGVKTLGSQNSGYVGCHRGV